MQDIAAVAAACGLRHEVKLVVIGGAAIQSDGRRYVTQVIDLTPDVEEAKLRRLADALNELSCRLALAPAEPTNWVVLPADRFTAPAAAGAPLWNLATPQGLLDPGLARSGSFTATPTSHRGDIDSRRGQVGLGSGRVARNLHASNRTADRQGPSRICSG